MIQNKKRIISLILMLTLLVSALVVGAVTASAEDGTWTLVTDASELDAGDKVVIVAKDYNYAMSTTQNSNNRGQAAVSKSGNSLTFTSSVQEFTLEEGAIDGSFAFYAGDAGYICAASSSSNYLRTKTTKDANASWKIEISNGNTTITAQGSYTRKVMQYNQSSSLFACYSSASQKAICIYKFVASTTSCEHTNKVAIGEAKNATCTEAGITAGEKCAACGEIITAQETIPATGHTYEDHKCACGASEPKATFFVNGVEYSTVYGETVTLPACDVDVSSFNKYSYTFSGWAVEEITEGVAETTFGKVGENVELATDKSFYAVFTYGQAGGEVVSYKKVTSAPADWSGTYLIVYENGNVIFNGARTTLDATSNYIGVTISDGKIAGNSEINDAVFSIVKSGSNYTIMSDSGYYIGQTDNTNGLISSTSTTYDNTISLNSDGSVQIVGSGGAVLRYNATSGQYRFRYFKSSTYTNQQAIHLYAETIETGTVAYYTTTLEKTVHTHDYEAVVTNPTCTEGGYTTYTCDCGDTYTADETPAAGHSFGEGLIDEVPATCVSVGTKAHKYCSVCEKYFNEAEEEVAYASLEIPVDSSAHDSSLEENGVCSDCGVFYSYTFTKKEFEANGTLSFDGVAWILGGDGGYWGYDSTKGQHLGSKNSPYTEMTIVLAGFNNVSKVVINTSGASDIEATLVVKIGETELGEITLTSTATEYTFTATEAFSGAITLEYTQTSSKAIYIKSVNVYGEQGSICDHSDVSVVDTATCTEGGVKTTTCNNCGYATSEDSVALGHSATCGHSVANSGDNYYAGSGSGYYGVFG